MSYASFTNLPASAKFPAHSVDVGRAVPARVGRGRLAALLVTGSSYRIPARCRCGLFRSRALSSVDPAVTRRIAAKYIPESLLIATLDLLVSIGHRQYSRIQTQPRHVFLWNGVSGVFLVFSFFLSTIFLLKILGRLLARYRHGPSRECLPRGTLHTDNMVLVAAVVPLHRAWSTPGASFL